VVVAGFFTGLARALEAPFWGADRFDFVERSVEAFWDRECPVPVDFDFGMFVSFYWSVETTDDKGKRTTIQNNTQSPIPNCTQNATLRLSGK
jgi:hypothetical protein